MLAFFENLFGEGYVMPHGHCYLWHSGMIGLHVISDSIITLAYYTIPVMLCYIIYRRRDIPFHWMFLMFGTFILACGTTHLMEIWTVWHPDYLLSGAVKACTALVSIATAFLLLPLLPRVLSLTTPDALRKANIRLQTEVNERKKIEEELRQHMEALERMNQVMVGRELKMAELKKEIDQLKEGK